MSTASMHATNQSSDSSLSERDDSSVASSNESQFRVFIQEGSARQHGSTPTRTNRSNNPSNSDTNDTHTAPNVFQLAELQDAFTRVSDRLDARGVPWNYGMIMAMQDPEEPYPPRVIVLPKFRPVVKR